uniref:Splicing factor 3B subunit 6 n=1 Tax=Cyprinus carpio carpio TaxID=630221 RepID=A0A9J8A4V6_CYPCA
MAMQAAKRANIRLPPEVNRILYIRNLPYKITAEEMYDIFGKYGPIRQIRVGNTPETRGTAYVVYEDIFDAKNACDHLSGFNVCNRYLVVLYYNANRVSGTDLPLIWTLTLSYVKLKSFHDISLYVKEIINQKVRFCHLLHFCFKHL